MSRTVGITVALTLSLTACSGGGDEIDEQIKKRKAETAAKLANKENIKTIESPVPLGKTIPCTQLIDAAKVSEALGQPLELRDQTKSDAEAAAVCALHTTGKPLTEKEQKKLYETQGFKIGVQPGDELCRVTAYCWTPPPEVAAYKRSCEEKGYETSNDIGDLTCRQTFMAGADDKFVYRVLDSDTKCILQTNPGPSVVGTEQPMRCAKVFSDLIGLDQIKVN
jgi:hypothetical protein